MSIPREVGLRKIAEGIRLVQKPAGEMEMLRSRHFQFNGGNLARANEWLTGNNIQAGQLEFAVDFESQSAGVEGVKVWQGAKDEAVIGVDWARSVVFVDRTNSGNVNFHAKFPGRYEAPLVLRDGALRLHVFVDTSSVEVFVNHGERVFTVLSFPSAESRGVKIFGPENQARIRALNVWNLKSSWR
jgi:fructan beta-fructosidase